MICITNSTHDISVAGLRFWPDLDALRTAAQAAGGATVLAELQRQGVAPSGPWQGFDDAAVAAAIARGVRLARGADAVQCAAAQSSDLAVTVLPLTQEPIELHVVEEDGAGARQSRHVLRWLNDTGRRAPEGFVVAGLDQAGPAPGVLDALRSSDIVVLPPMSPVLDASGMLAVPGVRDALRGTNARVVAMSPVALADASPHRSADDAAWAQAGLEPFSPTLARLYADFLDTLVIDESEPPRTYPARLRVTRAPLRSALLEGDGAAFGALRTAVLRA